MAVVLIDTEDLKKLISDAVAQELGKIASIRAQQPPTETYLTRAQVCEMFSINKSTLSLWQSKKRYPIWLSEEKSSSGCPRSKMQ